MKTLKLEDKTARQLYPKAAPEFKTLLEESFGKDFFSQKITDRIKTFEDACDAVGVSKNIQILLDYNGCDNDMIAAQAFAKLTIIAKALNEGWVPDWNNSNECKHWSYFDMRSSSGFGFSNAYSDNSRDLNTRLNSLKKNINQ